MSELRETLFANQKESNGMDLVALNIQRGRDFGLKGVPFRGSSPNPIDIDDLDFDAIFDEFFNDGGADGSVDVR